MRKLQCQSCGAALEWDGVREIVTCEACGMRYQMTPRDPRRAIIENARKGGCVAPRPVLEGDSYGTVHYISWLPEGWDYWETVNDLNFRYGSLATPFVPTLQMSSQDKRKLILWTTSNSYVDAPQTGFGTPSMGGGLLGGLLQAYAANQAMQGDPSILDTTTYIRKRTLASAAQLCDEVASFQASRFGLQIQQAVQQQDQPDAIAQKKFQELLKSVPPDVASRLWTQWCRKMYRAYGQDGLEYAVMAEVEVTTNGYNVSSPQQQGQNGRGFFQNLMGQFSQAMAQGAQQRTWQTDYELFMLCPMGDFDETMSECDRVRESIELGEDFRRDSAKLQSIMQQYAMSTQSTINNAAMQMAADNAAHFDRMSSITQEANDYTNNVMREMIASNAASHDRTANMNFEMVGGYNVYQGTDGNLVRADIGYDHVYQGNVDGQDWLVGVEGAWLEPGVDFVPLDKIDGGNY